MEYGLRFSVMGCHPCRILAGVVAVALLSFLTANLAKAQRATVGLKGGISQSTFVDNSSADFRSGVTGGGYIRYDVNSAFSIQTEAIFNMKGATADEGDVPAPFLRNLSGEF